MATVSYNEKEQIRDDEAPDNIDASTPKLSEANVQQNLANDKKENLGLDDLIEIRKDDPGQQTNFDGIDVDWEEGGYLAAENVMPHSEYPTASAAYGTPGDDPLSPCIVEKPGEGQTDPFNQGNAHDDMHAADAVLSQQANQKVKDAIENLPETHARSETHSDAPEPEADIPEADIV